MARTNKNRILFFFRGALGDFYLHFPYFDYLSRKHKDDLTYMCASPLALNLLYVDGRYDRFFDRLIPSQAFTPERIYSRVYSLDFNVTGVSATIKSGTHILNLLEQHYDATFDWDNLDSIFRLAIPLPEQQEVNHILERYTNKEKTDNKLSRNIVIHTTHKDKFPYGKTPPIQWWKELIEVFPQHRFFQVGTTQKLAERIVPDYNLRTDARLSNVIDLRDRLNLRQVAYLIEKTDFHITVDSIVSHLSRHSKKKGLTIWGSSDDELLGHEHNFNLSSRQPCSPCIDLTTNSNCCLKNNPTLYPSVSNVIRKLREHFLLYAPVKRSEWLISSNQDNVTKTL